MPFFFFFSFSTGFWTDCLKLFTKRFMTNYQETLWSRSDSFLGHTKTSFRKKWSEVVIRDASGIWYGLYMVTSIHNIQKSTRTNQKLGNKLASQWMAEDSRVKTERNWVVLSTDSEDVQIKKLIAAPCEAI